MISITVLFITLIFVVSWFDRKIKIALTFTIRFNFLWSLSKTKLF